MPESMLPFKIEPMTLADIPAVIDIEHISYSMTWPAKAYDYELQQNNLARYFVLRSFLHEPPLTTPGDSQGDKIVPGQPSTVIGLAGFWLMADEVHISTIAVHPDWRGLGLGEWLLLHLIEQGQKLGAQFATLEVRPSNHSAIALYHKYQFEEVGRRRYYYSDNNEDALIFTTPPLAALDYQAMLTQHCATLFQRLAKL